MKILRVIGGMDPKGGGPCQGIRNSIPALQTLGVHNEVVCLDAPDYDYLGSDSFLIHAIGPSVGPWSYSKMLIPWLQKHAEDFDLIIVHGLWKFSSFAVYKALKELKGNTTPYFVMPHGMLDPYFQKAPERRLKAIRNWLFWKLFESKVISHAAGVLFTCQEELMLARRTFTPYKPVKELNVGYGIQAPPVYHDKMNEAFKLVSKELNGKPYLLFLSRVHKKKGLDLLLAAYKIWVDLTKENEKLDLVIAGPGLETDYGKGLLKAVENDSTLKQYVHFTGMLSGDAKWGAFYGAEAFVLPSHQENFGIAIVEALACGKPVLISDKVNIWREIKNEAAGFVENDDFEGAINLLSKWGKLTSIEKKIMKQRAKKTFLKHYSIEPAAKRLLDALRKVIE